MLRNDLFGEAHDLVGTLRIEGGGVLVEQQELGRRQVAISNVSA